MATATQRQNLRNLQNRHVIEERGLRVLENRMLKDICGPKRDQVKVEWSKLHKEELRDFYSSPNIAVATPRGIRWAEHAALT